MRAVQHARKRAIGHRAGVVLQLTQPLQSQVANAIEVVVGEVGFGDHLVDERQAGVEKPIERGHPDHHRVHAHVEIELAADARHAIGDVERRLPAAAFVEEARGDRHQPDTPPRDPPTIRRAPAAPPRRPAPRDASPRAARGRWAASVRTMRGKWNGRSAPGNREPAAVDDAHETLTSTAPGSASSRRPRGTTLSDTDGALTSQLDTAEATPLLVTFTYRCRSRSK